MFNSGLAQDQKIASPLIGHTRSVQWERVNGLASK